jgi:hypothetical protein
MYGNGDGSFNYVHPSESGFTAYKDARDAVLLENIAGEPLIIVANNNEAAQFFKMKANTKG